jgi:hypothetical protein
MTRDTDGCGSPTYTIAPSFGNISIVFAVAATAALEHA